MTNTDEFKILFIGDISAKPGRQAVRDVLPEIRKKEKIDFVIANAENAAGGKGVTREILNELQSYGIDYFTAGEHVWDKKEFKEDLEDTSVPLVRPYNYENEKEIAGNGWNLIDLGNRKIIVACFLGKTFMRQDVRSPLYAFDEMYEEVKSRVGESELEETPFIVDFHAEATAEKRVFAWYVRDRVSAVLGTHTHVGTIDTMLMPGKDEKHNCAYISDVGMAGPQLASLWVDFDSVIESTKFPYKKSFKVSKSEKRIFNSVLVKIQKKSAKSIERIDKVV
ncbi:YmdB family metallophosphoesterase [Candidatus Dojkabacteria bacterium]|nr:YmdB family metallophosphoesterase [Candidatus Dojkabacteria bacterium]